MHGLTFETPCVTFYLWSPWRSSALEHRLLQAVRELPRVESESGADEVRVHVTEPKTWRAAMQAMSRVLKGWQEEADTGAERRSWRWLLESDCDPDGFDHQGERASIWGFLRATIETGGPGEADKAEDIDLEGFGFRIWGCDSGPA